LKLKLILPVPLSFQTTTIKLREVLLREIHPRQGQRVTIAPASCCRVWAAA
jgi:hypothetical protein